jgi:K+-transporting ATPase KdpF subunit
LETYRGVVYAFLFNGAIQRRLSCCFRHRPLREALPMNALLAFLSVGLFAYLLYALIKPERF